MHDEGASGSVEKAREAFALKVLPAAFTTDADRLARLDAVGSEALIATMLAVSLVTAL